MRKHYEAMLRKYEESIEKYLKSQVLDEQSLNYGGFISYSDEIVHPGSGIGALGSLVPLYCNKESRYYGSDLLYDRMVLALRFVKNIQRPDGTFDNLATNFYSSPDVAFLMHNLVPTYRVLDSYGSGDKCEYLKSELYDVIKKCGYGMTYGGFHTPNHRWMNASALLMAYNITKVEVFKEMAERYLSEGIDCDENGEYTERSAGVYNAVNDIALIYISEETGREELLEHVKRNLEMMFTYYEPDGTVFTQNSTRQDKGYTKTYPHNYYHIYLCMAYKFRDGRYMAMVNKIMDNCYEYAGGVPGYLAFYMCRPYLIDFEMDECPVPTEYEKFYEVSGVVRKRKENTTLTLLRDSSNFLFYQTGNLRFYMKICASFFAVAQFKPQILEKVDNKYILSFETTGSYRMPFETPPNTWEWHKMDHSKRESVNKLSLKMKVIVEDNEDELILNVSTEGCDRVPFKVEFGFTPDSVVYTEKFSIKGHAGDSVIIKNGAFEVRKGHDAVGIDGAFGKHTYASEMRGSDPQSKGEFTVYFTEYTNLEKKIIIKNL